MLWIRIVSLLIIIFQVDLSIILAQSEYITGRIIDSYTSESVPFVTIRLKNNQIGVFANADGEFKILNKSQFREDSLIFSCIGYQERSIKISELSSSEKNIIKLTPVTYALSEVKVRARRKVPGSLTIISRAIRNLKDNYPRDSFSYISYFRDYQKVNGKYINLNEAIVQTLDNGFKTKSFENIYRLLAYKKNTEFPRFSVTPYYDTTSSQRFSNEFKTIPGAIIHDQSGNELFILRAHDAIRNYDIRSFSFIDTLSINLLKNHFFSAPRYVFNGKMMLYRIEFSVRPKLIRDTLAFEGAIYIRLSDYSIHKLEYSGYYLNSQGDKKEMYSIKTEYGYNPEADSLMYLKYISFSNVFHIPDSTDLDYFRILKSYWQPTGDDDFHRMIVQFNNDIDPQSAKSHANYKISNSVNQNARISKLECSGKKMIIDIKKEDFKSIDSTQITINNLKDVNGNLLNKKRSIEIYQYRELFVQDNNKQVNFRNDCFMNYVPLEQNCISETGSVTNYWMNTPERIE